jgi:MerR family transcriptional regulator, thiopeptide resistance regulator
MGNAMNNSVKSAGKRWHRASEFAQLTGVTVRTLHHYDRSGLLKPSGHTAAGHRLYGERDFVRLQQVVTLKFLGFPLNQIKQILDRQDFDLAEAIRFQREMVAQKQRRLGRVVQALERVEGVLSAQEEPDWESFAKIVEAINMQDKREWMMQYYSEEARQAIEERAKAWTPELQAQTEQAWATLKKEVETAIADGADPVSERAQALATRWEELIHSFTLGNPAIAEGLGKLYADRANWPSDTKKPVGDEVVAFIRAASASRPTNGRQ